jgi:SAM-dependent methyltransferase
MLSGKKHRQASRIEREAEFHDWVIETDARAEVDEYYAVARRSKHRFLQLVAERAPGARVLDYGCGKGEMSLDVVRHGAAHVTGIDISPMSVNEAATRADVAGLSAQCEFLVMNAEELSFADGSFDLVYGRSIIHHLNLHKAFSELARVLSPGGIVVMDEPLGHNPVINWFRNRTPELRSADEHPLLIKDVALARRYFSHVDLEYFHLTSLGLIPLRSTAVFKPLYFAAEFCDRAMFKLAPPLRKMAWQVIMVMHK